jgi:hypothetical protein
MEGAWVLSTAQPGLPLSLAYINRRGHPFARDVEGNRTFVPFDPPFGREAFPDRIAFGLFAVLAGFLFLRGWALILRLNDRPVNSWTLMAGCGGGVVILLLPAFLALLHTRGAVWEEAVAYEYLYGMLLLGWLLAFARKPAAGRWLILCALAGLGAWVRPTLIFYGLATVATGGLVWFGASRHGHATGARFGLGGMRRLILAGVFVFGLGGAGLWWTNLKRFGDGFEFGHKLNVVQALYGSMYATRFDDPFQEESWSGAARELFGALFQVKQLRGGNYYEKDFFPGQSTKVRWREFYSRTYDWSYVPMLLLCWGGALWLLVGSRRPAPERAAVPRIMDCNGSDWRVLIPVLGVWSLLAALPLALFYLYTPVTASRYMMDFGPAFAAALAGGWMLIASCCGRAWSRVLVVGLLCGWFGWQMHQSRSLYGSPRSVTWEELRMARQSQPGNPQPSPAAYGQSLEDPHSGIPFDRTGWMPKTGALKSLVILFVKDAECLELELEPQPHVRIEANPEYIRAKIGLEYLERREIVATERGWRIRFHGPRQPRYQSGVQAAFVATVPKEFLTEAETPWVLRRVRWRESAETKENEPEQILEASHDN